MALAVEVLRPAQVHQGVVAVDLRVAGRHQVLPPEDRRPDDTRTTVSACPAGPVSGRTIRQKPGNTRRNSSSVTAPSTVTPVSYGALRRPLISRTSASGGPVNVAEGDSRWSTTVTESPITRPG